MMTTSKRELPLAIRGLDWLEIANEARSAVTEGRHGERVTIYARIAEKHGVNVHNIRRLVAGSQAYERVLNANSEHARTLLNLPFSAAEYLFRWYDYEPDRALEAAASYADREIGVRDLATLERQARGRWRHSMTFDRQELQQLAKQYIQANFPNASQYKFFEMKRFYYVIFGTNFKTFYSVFRVGMSS